MTRPRKTEEVTAPESIRPHDLQEVGSWLLLQLEDGPALVTELKRYAEKQGISQKLLQRAARSLPIIRRPRELRGPWTWGLPCPDELVLVRYECPLTECSKSFEGWMEFEKTRRLYSAGVVSYLVKGRVWRSKAGDEKSDQLRLRPAPL